VPSDEFRKFLMKTADGPRPVAKLRYRETLGTHILGALALSLGIAALARIAEIRDGADLISREIAVWLDPPPHSRMPVIWLADTEFVRYCGIAIVGQFLGMAGAWRSRTMKRTVSLFSVIGVATCTAALAPVYLLIAFWAVALAWPFLLGIAVLALVVQMLRLASRA
jgi:hypothetical protein